MFIQTREMQDRASQSPQAPRQKINQYFVSPKSSLSSQQISVKYEASPLRLEDMIADYHVPEDFIMEKSATSSRV